VVEEGSHQELIARGGIFAELYRIQQGGAVSPVDEQRRQSDVTPADCTT
jgi:hypothetical protein